jgi:hypothetical protein
MSMATMASSSTIKMRHGSMLHLVTVYPQEGPQEASAQSESGRQIHWRMISSRQRRLVQHLKY